MAHEAKTALPGTYFQILLHMIFSIQHRESRIAGRARGFP